MVFLTDQGMCGEPEQGFRGWLTNGLNQRLGLWRRPLSRHFGEGHFNNLNIHFIFISQTA